MILKSLTKLKQPLWRCFTIQDRATTIIRPQKNVFIPYDREMLKIINENPQYFEELKDKATIEAKLAKENAALQIKCNDNNPSNFIKLNIIENRVSAIEEEIESKRTDQPFIVLHKTKEPNPWAKGTYGTIRGSVKRVLPVASLCSKLHIEDALQAMEDSPKKCAIRIKNALNMVMHAAIQKGFNGDHLWVKCIQVQRQWRNKDIYYAARGKSGKMRRDWSRVYIELEEKPVQEIYRLFIEGNMPAGLSRKWRDFLREKDSDLETIRKFQFLLTSKGRQQRRLMIKRQAQKMQDEFLVRKQTLTIQAKGAVVNFDTIKEYVIEKEAVRFAEDYQFFEKREVDSLIEERKIAFNKLESAYK